MLVNKDYQMLRNSRGDIKEIWKYRRITVTLLLLCLQWQKIIRYQLFFEAHHSQDNR